ncbi:MaoC/PaaZ C-terminal domain-containing protein [Lutibaculum baratangense]|uniref:MaoC-like dehydratase n=1 Tax=Lutibaculum baratangense AMV1 TaxID=631454 RepID=V4RIS3_9HYPH|nr:MaoC/PaaZ C-terminal domain-containing protein [Lutibaculum baratangense]ESR23175.1 MaoC-like dehydratase [Lutibaculum baratangense AMV1]
MKFFEDIEIGEAYEIGPHLFTADEIVDFARKYDPQRFHLTEEGGRDSQFGGLCASGWHTTCAWMKHNVRYIERQMRTAAASGQRPPRIGPSPGFDELVWKLPVFPGDEVTYRNTVVGTRDLERHPGWGLVSFRVEARKADGALAMSFLGSFMLERREPLATRS